MLISYTEQEGRNAFACGNFVPVLSWTSSLKFQMEEAFFCRLLTSIQSGIPFIMSIDQTSQIRKEFCRFSGLS